MQKIEIDLSDAALDAITALVLERLREQGAFTPAKEWLSMKEARAISGLSEHEIRKRIKHGELQIHQPNRGRPPLLINRQSLLSSMGGVIDSPHSKEGRPKVP